MAELRRIESMGLPEEDKLRLIRSYMNDLMKPQQPKKNAKSKLYHVVSSDEEEQDIECKPRTTSRKQIPDAIALDLLQRVQKLESSPRNSQPIATNILHVTNTADNNAINVDAIAAETLSSFQATKTTGASQDLRVCPYHIYSIIDSMVTTPIEHTSMNLIQRLSCTQLSCITSGNLANRTTLRQHTPFPMPRPLRHDSDPP